METPTWSFKELRARPYIKQKALYQRAAALHFASRRACHPLTSSERISSCLLYEVRSIEVEWARESIPLTISHHVSGGAVLCDCILCFSRNLRRLRSRARLWRSCAGVCG